MPYINIRVTPENLTKETKNELIQRATQMLVDVLGKNPASIVVTIDEVATDNWGVGGVQVTQLRQKK
ncbi:MAG: 4-oxalocrotonate tautomerase family protein [Acidaminococcaceae bacterium]